jgi:hypothetical protein
MIERRRFLIMSVSVLGAAALAAPATDALAATPGRPLTHGSPMMLECWSRLKGLTVTATDAHGRSFPLIVDRVVDDQPADGRRGESFHVVLRARSRKLSDGIYRLAHRQLGGTSRMFLVGGAQRTATLTVDTRVGPAGS